jgi:DNA-directed RNA polymerase subunit beta'
VLRGVEADERPWVAPEGWEPGQPVLVETTLGRCLFNEAMPVDYPFVDHEVRKAQLGEVVNDLAERYPKVQVAATLDALKEAGFHWATRAGVTIAISDVVTPPEKAEILGRYEEQAEKVQKQYERGVITDDERRQELIEIWTRATTEVASKMRENFPKDNPIQMMVGSGARGNMLQVQQIAGMRGLVANPKGEIIPRPIKTNFREGLTVLEYFISTHGARKGLADTALRTADSGYLTRRLVDVSQDVIVREVDCGTDRGIMVPIAVEADGSITLDRDNVETRVYARTLAEDVVVNKKVLAEAGADLGDVLIGELVDQGVSEVRVRSVLTCDSKVGICGLCYGRSLATGKTVDVGEAVGIIAAQSIGEPGTQLTMRTFHTGGVAGEDITHGLPRVVELFEARQPKGRAPISEVAGRVSIAETDKSANFVVTPDDGGEPVEYPLSKRMLAWRWYDAESERARGQWRVEEGQHVEVGDQLHAGAVDPHEVLRILGPRAVQLHLVKEVQEVYRSQGVTIHDKHIEIIIRQMLKRVNILESGDTELLPGELAERPKFEEENRRVVAEGGTPAAGRPVLMGITKASLATESWLSAASFQETTRVLTDAAIHARSDSLLGLKENVIIGKLIPAGTGINRYRNVRVEPTEEAKAAVYTMMPYDDAGYDFGQGTGEAVPLEDYSFGQRPGGYGTDYGSGNYR